MVTMVKHIDVFSNDSPMVFLLTLNRVVASICHFVERPVGNTWLMR